MNTTRSIVFRHNSRSRIPLDHGFCQDLPKPWSSRHPSLWKFRHNWQKKNSTSSEAPLWTPRSTTQPLHLCVWGQTIVSWAYRKSDQRSPEKTGVSWIESSDVICVGAILLIPRPERRIYGPLPLLSLWKHQRMIQNSNSCQSRKIRSCKVIILWKFEHRKMNMRSYSGKTKQNVDIRLHHSDDAKNRVRLINRWWCATYYFFLGGVCFKDAWHHFVRRPT